MATAKLWVRGMTCGHCRAKVERALQALPGVYSAVVDLEDGEAEIDFDDDSLTTAQLIGAVTRAGYQARLAG